MAKAIDNLDKSLIDAIIESNKNDTYEELDTNNKTIIEAINEVFQSGNSAKQELVAALVAKGLSATTDMSFSQLIDNVETGLVKPAGTAVAGNVLSGKTFINSTGQTVTGTMANRGGAQTVTPGTSNKTLSAGYYSGAITVAGDADLVAANIVSGKNIFGVAGSATVGSLGGKVYKTGTISTGDTTANFTQSGSTTTWNCYCLVLSNLGFTPTFIFLEKGDYFAILKYASNTYTYKIIQNTQILNLKTDLIFQSNNVLWLPVRSSGTWTYYAFG